MRKLEKAWSKELKSGSMRIYIGVKTPSISYCPVKGYWVAGNRYLKKWGPDKPLGIIEVKKSIEKLSYSRLSSCF